MIDPRRFSLLRCLFVQQHSGKLAILLAIFLAVNCISHAAIERSVGIAHEHVFSAIAGILLAAGFIPLFLVARFSFGFIVGVSFYCVLTGFVWITYFSALRYDHDQARLSAIESLLMFLLPLFFLTSPIPRKVVLSLQTMNRILVSGLGLAFIVLAWAGQYGVALVGIHEAEELRSTFVRPAN